MNWSAKNLLCVRTALVAFISVCSATSDNDENFILNIFGNANLDNTINDQDIDYVRGVINGSKLATNLSDANYDGKTDENDIAQIEKIMNGDENELTIIDDAGDIITVQEPINRVVLIEGYEALYETWRALGINDKVIGINDRYVEPNGIRYSKKYYQELTTKQNVGSTEEPDMEVIASIAPDVFFIDWSPMYDMKSKLAKSFPHLPVICNGHNL